MQEHRRHSRKRRRRSGSQGCEERDDGSADEMKVGDERRLGGVPGKASGPSCEPARGVSGDVEHKGGMEEGRGKSVYRKNESVDDDAYFGGYSGIEIHQDMLQDRARTEAYRDAILENAPMFKGKAILDVGCGTAILSMFAKDAGARVVYAVDASKMATYAKRIVKKNKADDVIKVLHGKMEEIQLPEKVDIIISEWMGYFLVYESMLDSVLHARDRWLKPDGKMFPAEARLFLGGFRWPEYIQENLGYWRNVYGKDFTALIPLAYRSHLKDPVIDELSVEQEVTGSNLVKDINLMTIKKEDLSSWSAEFSLQAMISASVHGIFAWFEVEFPSLEGKNTDTKSGVEEGEGPVILSTAPEEEPTHWGQALFFFNDFPEIQQDDLISGTLNVRKNDKNPRFLDIQIRWRHEPSAKEDVNGGSCDKGMPINSTKFVVQKYKFA